MPDASQYLSMTGLAFATAGRSASFLGHQEPSMSFHLGRGKRRACNRKAGRPWACVTSEELENRLLLAAHIIGSSTRYATIQAAVNAAAPKAIITVDAGTYSERVTVNKSLTIQGAQAGVDARSNGRAGAAESIVSTANGSFYITANDVTIDGFTIQGETN